MITASMLLCLGACSFQAPELFQEQSDRNADGWIDGFSTRKTVTIRPPALEDPLTGFPVAITLPADPDIAAAVQAAGPRIAITDLEGNALPFELETLDATSGKLTVWVRIATLAGDTDVILYYGGQPAPVSSSPGAVWSGSFASVWHLSDDPGTAGPQFIDSAGQNHGSASGALTPSRIDGIAGDAMDFDGVDDYILIGDPADESLDFGAGSFSWSVWVRVEASANQFDLPWHKGGSNAGIHGYCFVLGTGDWRVGLSDGATLLPTFGDEPEFLDRWVHLVGVVDRAADGGDGEARSYADGQLIDTRSLASTGSLSTDEDATISRPFDGFRGRIDEVRVYSRALTDDWIATERANLIDPAAFLGFGNEQRLP